MLLELCWSMVWRTRLHQGGIWINNELSAAWSAEGCPETEARNGAHRNTGMEYTQESQTRVSVLLWQFYGTILAAQPPPGASLTFNLVVLLTCVLVIL